MLKTEAYRPRFFFARPARRYAQTTDMLPYGRCKPFIVLSPAPASVCRKSPLETDPLAPNSAVGREPPASAFA
jgi:hypothetical protein